MAINKVCNNVNHHHNRHIKVMFLFANAKHYLWCQVRYEVVLSHSIKDFVVYVTIHQIFSFQEICNISENNKINFTLLNRTKSEQLKPKVK